MFTTPTAWTLSPAETAWNALISADGEGQTTPATAVGDAMSDALRDSGVPFLDGFAVFQAESRSPDHAPLFGTQDEHLSIHGRAVIARALAAYFEKLHPWK